jgi:3-oxoacyl-[acyl-carrier protein] reductase
MNTVDPGATDIGYADDELLRRIAAREPMGRWGKPDDTARMIARLTGPDAGWVIGQVIVSSAGPVFVGAKPFQGT